MRFFFIILYSSLIILSSCSGYHFNINSNPLIGYDIKSVAVPMFVNRSVLPQLTAPLTKEITSALSDYSGLKVVSGENDSVYAVLIGIIESRDHYNEVVKNSQLLFTEGDIQNAIGNRTPFYYPIQTSYDFRLRIILIKRPSKEELAFLTDGKVLNGKLVHPKIVLEDSIALSNSFSRVAATTSGADASGEVNFVKNKGIFEKSLQETSLQAAKNFKQVVLNAF